MEELKMEMLKRFIRDEQGLETVEYAVILGLIVVAAIVVIGTVGNRVANAFTQLLAKNW
jgi:Flp pilus assembly pilin Flp